MRSLVTCPWLPSYSGGHAENALMGIYFKQLQAITPVVLLPSERLPTHSLPPIIDSLWFRILRQVPGREWGGRRRSALFSHSVRVR